MGPVSTVHRVSDEPLVAKMPGNLARILLQLSALGIGSAPGFAVPFIANVRLAPSSADGFLLGVAISIIVMGITTTSFEASMIGALSRQGERAMVISEASLRQVAWRGATRSAPLSLGCYGLIATTYGVINQSAPGFLLSLIGVSIIALVPVIATSAGTWSAVLIVEGRSWVVIASSFFRGGPAIALLLLENSPSVILLGASYVLGEVGRLLLLNFVARRASGVGLSGVSIELPARKELGHQYAAAAVAQGAPFFARVLFALGPPGTIALAESANRVYSALLQVANSAIVLPAVSSMRLLLSSPNKKPWASAVRVLVLKLTALSLAGALLLLFARSYAPHGVRAALDGPFLWSLLFLVGLPFAGYSLWASRVLVARGLSVVLFRSSVWSLIAAVACGICAFRLVGPVGGVYAIVVVQVVGSALYAGGLARGPDAPGKSSS